jgi:hypothetical protein
MRSVSRSVPPRDERGLRPWARVLLAVFITSGAGAVSVPVNGCSSQASAYRGNPMCKQAEQKCRLYYETMDRTKTDRGAGIELLREDCEASQRACADGVSRSLETSHPGEPGERARWQDVFYR